MIQRSLRLHFQGWSHHHPLLVDAPHEAPELVALDGALGTVGAVVNAAGPLLRGVERRVVFPLALVSVPRRKP